MARFRTQDGDTVEISEEAYALLAGQDGSGREGKAAARVSKAAGSSEKTIKSLKDEIRVLEKQIRAFQQNSDG